MLGQQGIEGVADVADQSADDPQAYLRLVAPAQRGQEGVLGIGPGFIRRLGIDQDGEMPIK